jgi:hypothetical protein
MTVTGPSGAAALVLPDNGSGQKTGISPEPLTITIETVIERETPYGRWSEGRIYIDNVSSVFFALPTPMWQVLSIVLERGCRGADIQLRHVLFKPRTRPDFASINREPEEEPIIGGFVGA